ncbi:MAG: Fic family protein [Lentisphaerae bacterium]|jgi:Fic family protein|nr:Fic family protein [Lentisphaerota bacterium]
MKRETGTYRVTKWENEDVRAFVPAPLPPANPPLALDDKTGRSLSDAMTALGKLAIAADMVPNAEWFLYGFVRKEALITSQIEGTQATLQDVLAFEAGEKAERPDDVREVCNYVDALTFARGELARPKGLPLATRLLCDVHKRLMKGARGSEKQPGEIRRSQNWIGGSRPGNARFVPPPPDVVPEALSALEKWIHGDDSLPPLVRIGLAHVQFETIHPFLDGNGRIGRLLIALLVEHWGLLKSPLLYLSVAFKRHRQAYYDRLNGVRVDGDWEGWMRFFLDCVTEAADDAVASAQRLHVVTAADRTKVAAHAKTTVPAIRLFELLPSHPMVTLSLAIKLLGVSKPTAVKALDALQAAGVLREITGKRRDRVYAYHEYLRVLSPDTD